MMEALHLESPAKVNLRLEILKKREDGYHELRTILQKINLHDLLHFSLKKEKGISMITDHPDLPIGKSNLIYQAAQSILEIGDYKGGVHIKIEKRIPLGAGLGGGSSNAATTLMAMNRLLKVGLLKRELMSIGLKIGADVPFFFSEGGAIASGIGEKLKKIDLPELWYVLIYPNFEVSTRWAYQNFTFTHSTAHPRPELGSKASPIFKSRIEKRRSGSTLSFRPKLNLKGRPHASGWEVEGLTRRRFHFKNYKLLKIPNEIYRLLWNDLEEVVSLEYPQISVMKRILYSAGALGASMTGSGPTVFGVFSEEGGASEAYKKVKGMVRAKGWIVLIAHGISA
jgi:4-diphosphocytidyl-2-C-methyl-D-erythritol kinase